MKIKDKLKQLLTGEKHNHSVVCFNCLKEINTNVKYGKWKSVKCVECGETFDIKLEKK